MKVYVVHHTVGGYAREDSDRSAVAGAYSELEKAKLVAKACYGSVQEVELDFVFPGYVEYLKMVGVTL